jgi:hypothetical protein
MTTADVLHVTSLQRWSSSSDSTAAVAELSMESMTASQLSEALTANASRVRGCSMLIVRLGTVDRPIFLGAWATAQAAKFPIRICFAVDRTTLATIGPSLPADERVGLLLDGVDDTTPPVDVVNEAIEAIRFDSRFVAKATRHLRSECVLDALLTLAKNAGLATLGPESRSTSGSWLSPQIDFDYVAKEAI